MASLMGLAIGLILARFDEIRTNLFGNKRGFGTVIFVKAVSYIVCIVFIVGVVSFIFLFLLGADSTESINRITAFVKSTYFLTIISYGAVVSFLISFVKQVDSKFGPGNLMNMLIGRYHKPRIEDRIFLFMDLKNATGYAERLGHIKYSQLLQDCFEDMTKIVTKYFGEIYQFVGDEIVITWNSLVGIKNANCLHLVFGFLETINNRSDFYLKNYGFKPEFKAGMNCGHITVAEVGNIKREIAYHGDVINTASRIQHQCNRYKKNILISRQLYRRLKNVNGFRFSFTDAVQLKGKQEPVELYTINS
jgi:adenylate cyclase